MKKAIKLSHIIFIVEQNTPKEDICAFCTNVNKSLPIIRLTYHSYDNLSEDDLYNLFKKYFNQKDDLLIITDSQKVINYTLNIGIATVGLYTERNKKDILAGVLYCIEDPEFIDPLRVVKMWQRFHNIPWTVTETDRLIIREQTIDDLDNLYGIYSHPDITKYMENLYENREDEYKYLEDYISHQYRFFEYGIWALCKKDDNTFIGRAGLSLREGSDILELGFVIGKEYQKQGYAYEACKAIINYAYDELEADKISALCRPENTDSVKLLQKLGFKGKKQRGMLSFLLTKS